MALCLQSPGPPPAPKPCTARWAACLHCVPQGTFKALPLPGMLEGGQLPYPEPGQHEWQEEQQQQEPPEVAPRATAGLHARSGARGARSSSIDVRTTDDVPVERAPSAQQRSPPRAHHRHQQHRPSHSRASLADNGSSSDDGDVETVVRFGSSEQLWVLWVEIQHAFKLGVVEMLVVAADRQAGEDGETALVWVNMLW